MEAPSPGGFVAFFERYARTWVHAVATAALTLFGTLTFVHRGFAAVAVASYLLPPVALYLADVRPGRFGGKRAAADDRDAGRRGGAASPADDGPEEPDRGTRSAERWASVDAPTDARLHDAAVTGGRAYAVGAGGVVLAAEPEERWRVALADGPGVQGRDLRAVDDAGDAVWVAGDGGALGRLDAAGRHVDHSAPLDRTDAWTALAAASRPSGERLLLANGSGEVFAGAYRDGELSWTGPTKPGSGSSVAGAALVDGGVGYVCDTDDGVFETAGGARFDRVGVEGAAGTLVDVAAAGERVAVAVDDGTVHRRAGETWTPTRASEAALSALALSHDRTVACDEAGAVHERTGAGWERHVTPARALYGVAVGADRAVAVGADGSVVERRNGP